MILAIDLGSTSFKVGLFDSGHRPIHTGSAKLRYHFGPQGAVEIEPAVIHQTLRKALSAIHVEKQSISAIAITSQAQTFTVANFAGRPTRPFVSWQDGRAERTCQKLRRQLPDFADHCSFGSLLPALQICQIRHAPLKKNQMVLNLPSYIVRLWTGQAVIDDNLAAMTGLYSLKFRNWWPRALEACELTAEQLPGIVPIGTIAAITTPAASRFGLPPGIPITLAGNDQTAAAFDAQLHRKTAMLVTLGTAQVAYVCLKHLPGPQSDVVRGNYPGGLFYHMVADGCGGNIINWAQTLLKSCDNDRHFFAEASRGRHELTFDASLDTGEGAWRGLGFHHTPADFARSILQTLTQRMSRQIARLGVRLRHYEIHISGGGAQQPLWIKLLADTLRHDVIRSNASALSGAARMAAQSSLPNYSPA